MSWIYKFFVADVEALSVQDHIELGENCHPPLIIS